MPRQKLLTARVKDSILGNEETKAKTACDFRERLLLLHWLEVHRCIVSTKFSCGIIASAVGLTLGIEEESVEVAALDLGDVRNSLHRCWNKY